MTQAEEWRAIEGFPYEVSSLGRVRGKRGFLKPSPRRNYLGKITHYVVNLGRGNMRRVHHLVLVAFVGPRPCGLQACHYDGDPANNQATNLRWDTAAANQADSIRHGTKKAPPLNKRGSRVDSWFNEDDIRCIRAEPYFRGVNQMLGKCFGISYMTAYRIRKAA